MRGRAPAAADAHAEPRGAWHWPRLAWRCSSSAPSLRVTQRLELRGLGLPEGSLTMKTSLSPVWQPRRVEQSGVLRVCVAKAEAGALTLRLTLGADATVDARGCSAALVQEVTASHARLGSLTLDKARAARRSRIFVSLRLTRTTSSGWRALLSTLAHQAARRRQI